MKCVYYASHFTGNLIKSFNSDRASQKLCSYSNSASNNHLQAHVMLHTVSASEVLRRSLLQVYMFVETQQASAVLVAKFQNIEFR